MDNICLKDTISSYFDLLCAKHHILLNALGNVSEVDTLLGIVWQHRAAYKNNLGVTSYIQDDSGDTLIHSKDVNYLIEELRHVYAKLAEMGISNDDARKALWDLQPVSRLKVSLSLELSFPDYSDKKVRMTRMQYSIYMLFLNHPEGIKLKNLPDHIEELYLIYRESLDSVQEKCNSSRVMSMLKNITNPSKHSMIEYISRIRHIIIDVIGSEDLAANYFIRGIRNGRYAITLSREFCLFPID